MNPILSNIREKIAERLMLDLSMYSAEVGTQKILNLMRTTRYLLILDDMWNRMELKEVGIPRPNNKNGSKIIVVSRLWDVCTDMEADHIIELKKLPEEEAWSLFLKKTGMQIDNPSIKQHAEAVLKNCEGLPLAIITVGRAMANRHTTREWDDAKRELEQLASNLRGMVQDVFIPLKFSYDRLDYDAYRSFFLYCALFPQDYLIGELEISDYCIAEGLVDDRRGDLKDVRDKGKTLVGSLKNSCMLEGDNHENTVKMHDVMRDSALWITSSESGEHDPKFIVWAHTRTRKGPRANEWQEADRISLVENDLQDLPQLPQCPKLVTLMLQNNHSLNVIPQENFFQCMCFLRMLNLSLTGITSLPSS
ncbi:hypothetical protein AMTRI_Chr03g147020 [Amborella trichopoda]